MRALKVALYHVQYRSIAAYLTTGLLLLNACYKVPGSLLKEIPVTLSLENSLEEALKSEKFQEGPWPNSDWWAWFSDPQLAQLIEEGLANSPDLKRVEARVEESLNIATKIRAKLFPHVNFFFQENYQHLSAHGYIREFAFHSPPPSQIPPAFQGINFTQFATPVPAVLNVLDLGFNMNWNLDIFGKNRNQWAASIGQARVAEAEAKQIRLGLSSQIAQSYFSYQTHRAVLEVYKKILSKRIQLKNLIKERESAGLETQFETDASQIDLLSLKKIIYDLEQSVILDQHRLLVLVGVSPDAHREWTFNFTPISSKLLIPKEISLNLLARRPDLMAEIWRVEKAAAEIGVAKAQFYPDINLQGLLSLRSVFPDQLFSLSSAENSLLPVFTLPIFRGGELKANLGEKLAQFQESVYSYHQSLLEALQNVADLLTKIQWTDKQLSSQKELLEFTEHRKTLKEQLCHAGVSSYLSCLEFDVASLNQTIALINLQSDQILLAVKLMQALGGGYQAPLEIPSKFIRSPKEKQ